MNNIPCWAEVTDVARLTPHLINFFGDGVIGNTTGSDPVIGGSSPPPRASKYILKVPAPFV